MSQPDWWDWQAVADAEAAGDDPRPSPAELAAEQDEEMQLCPTP